MQNFILKQQRGARTKKSTKQRENPQNNRKIRTVKQTSKHGLKILVLGPWRPLPDFLQGLLGHSFPRELVAEAALGGLLGNQLASLGNQKLIVTCP